MPVARCLRFCLLVALASPVLAQPVQLDVVVSFQSGRGEVPTVFWFGERICVPARVGFLCHDLGPIPRAAPSSRRSAPTKLRPPQKGKLMTRINGELVRLDTVNETIQSVSADAGSWSFRDAYCPNSAGSAREWIAVIGDRPEQVALLRRDRFAPTTACLDAAPDCQLDEFTDSWSVLAIATKCEVRDE